MLFVCLIVFKPFDKHIWTGCQYFVFFYLNIEGWKVSAEQQLQAIELDFLKTGNSEKQVSLAKFIFRFSLIFYLISFSYFPFFSRVVT